LFKGALYFLGKGKIREGRGTEGREGKERERGQEGKGKEGQEKGRGRLPNSNS